MSFYAQQKVLVAGGTGTTGIPLVERLVALGARVTVVSMDEPDYAKQVLGPSVAFERADLRELEACLEAVRGQDIVLNLIGAKGSTGIGTSLAASYFVPMLRYQTNFMDAAFQAGVSRFLFVSSICAYPQAELHEEDNLWNGMPRQNDRYPGIAKRVGEVQAQTYLEEHGWDAVRIVRPSNIYGPFDDFNPATAQVIGALIGRVAAGEAPLKVWGDGSAIRDFIFSEDAADGMLVALEKAPACLPINLGSGTGATIREVAEAVAEQAPHRPRIEWDPSGPTGDPVRVLSMKRAMDVIGFEAPTSLRDGIGKTMSWVLEHPDLAGAKRSMVHG